MLKKIQNFQRMINYQIQEIIHFNVIKSRHIWENLLCFITIIAILCYKKRKFRENKAAHNLHLRKHFNTYFMIVNDKSLVILLLLRNRL